MKLEAIDRAIDTFRRRPRAIRLVCGVQHYSWGDPDAIPNILGLPNPNRRPFAELWAGAHPDLPSIALINGVYVPLDQLIRELPEIVLGTKVAERYDTLPFLLKVLAAAQPLSLQAHPNKAQARAGFERENRAGLALDEAARNYRDPNHKPELLEALTEFYALRGFRPIEEIEHALEITPELAPLAARFDGHDQDIADLFSHIMRLDQEDANSLLAPLIGRIERENETLSFPRDSLEHWLLRADRAFSVHGRRDRGLLCMYLLNLVHLRPGEAIYMPAGELHTYLEGVGIEIMASSNNVLRGGLTRKHVDVEELLGILSYRSKAAKPISPSRVPRCPGLITYRTPAEEFALSRLELAAGQARDVADDGPLLGLLTGGEATIEAADQAPELVRSGEGILVPPGLHCNVSSPRGAILWIAVVPGNGPENPRDRTNEAS